MLMLESFMSYAKERVLLLVVLGMLLIIVLFLGALPRKHPAT